jgi:hypothetical protein
MIDEQYLNVVGLLLSSLRNLNHPWAVTGSLGLRLQGIEVAVHDIDLQSTQEGVFAMARALSEYVVQKVELLENKKIRSYFGELKIMGIKVEIMGDVQKEWEGEWGSPIDLPASIHWVKLRGWSIPVLDLEAEYNAYRTLGREEKAARIRAVLDERDGMDWRGESA